MVNVYVVWQKGDDYQVGQHFRLCEFECKCSLPSCQEQRISLDLVRNLDRVRRASNSPLSVNSAYRCPEHNRAVGGVEGSQHTLGNAVDCSSSAKTPLELRLIAQHFFKAIGTGSNFLHLDTRDDKVRRWTYPVPKGPSPSRNKKRT